MRKILSERRQHRRFRVKQPVFAVFETEPVKLREVLDIGMGGLSLSYLDDGAESLRTVRQISIVLGIYESECYLSHLPFKVVSERPLHDFPPSPIKRRRYGLQFHELTPEQQEKLQLLVNLQAEPEQPPAK